MSSKYPAFTVDVPADFELRFASLFVPASMPPGMNLRPKYTCCFPADQLPYGAENWLGVRVAGHWKPGVKERNGIRYSMARSAIQPIILPGQNSGKDLNNFAYLKWLCENTYMPLDWIFRERHIRLRVQPFEFRQPQLYVGEPRHHRTEGISLHLEAVQIMDLEEGFLRRELKRRLENMEK